MDCITMYYKFIDLYKSIVEFKNITCIFMLHYYYYNFDKLFEFNITEIFWLLLIDFTLMIISMIVLRIYCIFDYIPIYYFRSFNFSKHLHQPQTMNTDDYHKLIDTSIIGININKINLAVLSLCNWRLIDIVKVAGEDMLLIGFFDEKFNQYKYLGFITFILLHTESYESFIKLLLLGIKYNIILSSGRYHFVNHNIYHILLDILLLSLLSYIDNLNILNNNNLVSIEDIEKYIINILYFNKNKSLYQDLIIYHKDKFPNLKHVLNIRSEILMKYHRDRH
jgi:hypothetical protein